MSPTEVQAATDVNVGLEPRLIKALSHPLRQRILYTLGEGVASPSELSRRLGEPLGNVSYHVKILAECKAIELVRTAPVRGAVEHFYQATIRPYFDDNHWADLPLATRRALFDNSLQEIWSHLVAAAEQGGLDDAQSHVSWTELELDDEAYAEMAEQLKATLDRAMELHAESMARLAELPSEERESHRTELAMMHFHRAPGSPSSQIPPIRE
ncbi:MAG TPA: winged helix-turn-helix domain-containing protein [Solirubrobacterales bacterium]|nr:winged helix-turn-helix domain-containing protein [Solirubrobacterales bacterium]